MILGPQKVWNATVHDATAILNFWLMFCFETWVLILFFADNESWNCTGSVNQPLHLQDHTFARKILWLTQEFLFAGPEFDPFIGNTPNLDFCHILDAKCRWPWCNFAHFSCKMLMTLIQLIPSFPPSHWIIFWQNFSCKLLMTMMQLLPSFPPPHCIIFWQKSKLGLLFIKRSISEPVNK